MSHTRRVIEEAEARAQASELDLRSALTILVRRLGGRVYVTRRELEEAQLGRPGVVVQKSVDGAVVLSVEGK